MLVQKLVTEIFRMEYGKFFGNAGALHEIDATADFQRVLQTWQSFFHPFEGAADNPIDGDGHAAACDLVAEHVNPLEAHLFDDHVEEVDAVRARFAQSKADRRIDQLKRDSGETSTAADVNHAGGPLGHLGVDKRTVGVMAFHHRLERIEARQVLVVVVRTEQLVEFPELLERLGLKFHTVVVQQLVEPGQRRRDTLSVEKRELRPRSLHVRDKVLAKRTGTTGFGIF